MHYAPELFWLRGMVVGILAAFCYLDSSTDTISSGFDKKACVVKYLA